MAQASIHGYWLHRHTYEPPSTYRRIGKWLRLRLIWKYNGHTHTLHYFYFTMITQQANHLSTASQLLPVDATQCPAVQNWAPAPPRSSPTNMAQVDLWSLQLRALYNQWQGLDQQISISMNLLFEAVSISCNYGKGSYNVALRWKPTSWKLSIEWRPYFSLEMMGPHYSRQLSGYGCYHI